MVRIDAIWLATEPMDMRAGPQTGGGGVFGAVKPHCAYLFADRRTTRMKVLVHDEIGIWLAASGVKVGFLVLTMTAPAMELAPWLVVCGPRNTSMESTSQVEVPPKYNSL